MSTVYCDLGKFEFLFFFGLIIFYLLVAQMTLKLKDKEAAITSLKKRIEAELLNEKETREKALARANEEQQTLANLLKLATDTINNLVQELQREKRVVEQLTVRVDDLEVSVREAGDEKTELQNQLKEKLNSVAVLQERINLLYSEIKNNEDTLCLLDSKLADKERELNQLRCLYQQLEDPLTILNSEIKELKDLLLKNEEELELKNEMIHKLNADLTSSLFDKEESSKKLDAILKEYNQFKLSTEEKSTSDSKLLGETELKIHQLEEQLKLSVDELCRNKVLISDLTQENNNLKEMLTIEQKNAKNLGQELKTAQHTSEKSRDEASNLAEELQQSRNLCSELEAELSKLQAEFSEATKSLLRDIDEEKQVSKALAGELTSAVELLSKSNEKLQILSQESAAALRKSESLEKELVVAHAKAESAAVDLKEEKKITSSLNKELKVLETQLFKDKEARRSLESDLEETSKSLDEMNRAALMLSSELELANSRIPKLEDERETLYRSIYEQKQTSQEARENLEYAHNLVVRLGDEKEKLVKRGQKLEEEVAFAKGEILRLRSQMNSSETSLNDDQKKREVDTKKVMRGER